MKGLCTLINLLPYMYRNERIRKELTTDSRGTLHPSFDDLSPKLQPYYENPSHI